MYDYINSWTFYSFFKSATLSVDDCDVGLSLKYGEQLGNYLCANVTINTLEKRYDSFSLRFQDVFPLLILRNKSFEHFPLPVIYRCSDFIQTCYRYLDLTGPLQIGGLPALQSDFQVQNKYFTGCIMDFYVDNQLVDLNR